MIEALGRAASVVCRMAAEGELSEAGVALVDMGGHVVVLWRSPAIGFFYVDLATSKAWTAAALRRDPVPTGERIREAPATAAFLSGIAQGRLAPMNGGALLVDAGQPIGGIGVGGPAGSKVDEVIIARIAERAGLSLNA